MSLAEVITAYGPDTKGHFFPCGRPWALGTIWLPSCCFFLTLACAHTSAMGVRPAAKGGRAAQHGRGGLERQARQEYANALAVEFSMRDGVVVAPQARTRLLLNLCRLDVSTEVDVTQTYSAGAATLEQRDQAVRGHGMAVLTIEVDGQPVGMLNSERKRVRMVREETLLICTSGRTSENAWWPT